MEIKLDIPEYYPNQGLSYKWQDGFSLDVKIDENSVILTANKEGLVSLANHLLNLAQDRVPNGCHLHLDEYNSLDEGSVELVIQKK